MPVYPLIPETTKQVEVGDFWSIELECRRFSVGRVLQIVSRTTVLGAVLNWSDDRPPTKDSIAGAELLKVGLMHAKRTIQHCGSGIVGNRSLVSDGIELPLFRSHAEGPGQRLLRGSTDIGTVDGLDSSLPVLTTWGFGVARLVASKQFC